MGADIRPYFSTYMYIYNVFTFLVLPLFLPFQLEIKLLHEEKKHLIYDLLVFFKFQMGLY